MTRVKICGITNHEDAHVAVDAGADALGFIFYPGSPRYVTPESVREITRTLPPFVTTVGVFVNETPEHIDEVLRVSGVRVPQLHGEEPPEYLKALPGAIKAVRVRSAADIEGLAAYRDASALLLDAWCETQYGGTGECFNWSLAEGAAQYGRLVVAGGLTPANVGEAVAKLHPYAVDVSSGVERDKGLKDHALVREFIRTVRQAH